MSKRNKRKASALRILAAQNNGAKSRGPATPEGRATSARNAIRHNMCSKALVLTMEDEEAFAEHQKAYFDQFQPEGEIEFGLVTDMVAAKWRTWRIWNLETALFDLQMDKQTKMVEKTFQSVDNTTLCAIAFQTLADQSKALSLLLRYETSMRRMHEKCLATLMKLQALRKSGEASLPAAATAPAPAEQGRPAINITKAESIACFIPADPIQKLQNEPKAQPPGSPQTSIEEAA